jgi:probable HAF family extracellular repeat protein
MRQNNVYVGFCILSGLFIASEGFFASSYSAPPRYHIIDLGARLAGDYHILDMNAKNQVVGYVKTGSLRNAFVWRNGNLEVLKSFGDGCEAIAEGINDSGTVVGYAYTAPGTGRDDFRIFHAVFWDTNGTIMDLGTMGGYRSVAFDINRNGQVAGFYCTNDEKGYIEHIYIWEKGGYRELKADSVSQGKDMTDAFYGISTIRNGDTATPGKISPTYTLVKEVTLNNNGDVASFLASNDGLSYSLLWTHQGKQIDLNADRYNCPLWFYGYFASTDMNDSMNIGGHLLNWVNGLFSTSYEYHPAIWSLRDPCSDTLEGYQTSVPFPTCINNMGTICGTSSGYATIWQNDSVFHLEDYLIPDSAGSSYHLQRAIIINDSGAIAVEGDVNGKKSAFLLIPQSPKIVMPTLGKFTITLVQASAKLVSDVYLYQPDSVLMIKNNLKNVGKTYDTIYPAGTQLEFAINVHPLPGKGDPYWFYSDSKHARVTKMNDSLLYIRFEDLPDSIADWDFNDVVLKVELNLLGPLPNKASHPRLLSMPKQTMSGIVDAYDVRGRRLGTFTLDTRGRLTDKSGRPAYGVHFIKPRGCATANSSRKILNIR